MKTISQNTLKILLVHPTLTSNKVSSSNTRPNLIPTAFVASTASQNSGKVINTSSNNSTLLTTPGTNEKKLLPSSASHSTEPSPQVPSTSTCVVGALPFSFKEGSATVSRDLDNSTSTGSAYKRSSKAISTNQSQRSEKLITHSKDDNLTNSSEKCKNKGLANCYLLVESGSSSLSVSKSNTTQDGVGKAIDRDIIEDEEGRKENFCSTCSLNCGSFELLQEHKGENGFFCRVCTAEFKLHNELEAHFAIHFIFHCKNCKKTFPSKKELWKHRKSTIACNLKLDIECEICHMKFFTRPSLRSHKRNHHKGNNATVFKCNVCDKSLKKFQYGKDHMLKSHRVYESLECKFCQKLLLGPERLKTHIKSSHLSTVVIHDCSTCGKIFKSKWVRDKHLKIHDVSVNGCEICGKSMIGKIAMKAHMISEHPTIGIFTCKHCNEQFTLKADLKRHYNRKHKRNQKSAFCEICGKVLKSVEILKRHQLTHSEEKTFKCEVCGASFKQSASLLLHSRIHSSVNKFVCDSCGKSFKWKPTFKNHVKKCVAVGGDDKRNTI